MFCLFSNIFVCSYDEINLLNVNNFNYIINCSLKYNSLLQNENYLNLDIDTFNSSNLTKLFEVYTWLEQRLNSKIIIFDETGLDNSIFITIYFMMKYNKTNFSTSFDNIVKIIKLKEKIHYSILQQLDYTTYTNSSFFSFQSTFQPTIQPTIQSTIQSTNQPQIQTSQTQIPSLFINNNDSNENKKMRF